MRQAEPGKTYLCLLTCVGPAGHFEESGQYSLDSKAPGVGPISPGRELPAYLVDQGLCAAELDTEGEALLRELAQGSCKSIAVLRAICASELPIEAKRVATAAYRQSRLI